MKLPHFLIFCASVVSATAIAQSENPTRPAREERGGFGPQSDFNRERPERVERIEKDERSEELPRDPRTPMTLEERRQLRRDVNDAGREIYRRPEKY